MGKCFNQITREDRIVINHLLRTGVSKAKIAEQLSFHRSTIYREVKRHSNRLGYMPFLMKRKLAESRKRGLKLDSNKQLRNYIFKKLQLTWSPEQIAGRLKLENNGKSIICHETIYSYLYSDDGIRNRYYLYLRDKRLFRYPKISRRTRTLIPNRVPILERPEEIRYRKSLGHWAGDLMQFGKKTKTNLITLRERQSRLKKTYDELSTRLKDLNLGTNLSKVSKIKFNRSDRANGDTLCAHATNGVAVLLAILTRKQLLPSTQRKEMGIPTLTGEASYFNKKIPNEVYHTEWQNFVSTVVLQFSAPDINVLNEYAAAAKGKFSLDSEVFIKKLKKIYKKFNINELDIFFDKNNEEVACRLYKQLSSIGVIIIGDGIGYAKSVHSMGSEKKYERVNIRAIVSPDKQIDYFRNLFSLIKVNDILILSQRDFQIFCMQKQASNIEAYKKIDYWDSDSISKNPITPFSKNFIDTFGSKMLCNFYFNSKEVTIDTEMEYKNKDKNLINKIVPVTYFEEEIIPFSDLDETLKNKSTLTSFNSVFYFKSFPPEEKEKTASDHLVDTDLNSIS